MSFWLIVTGSEEQCVEFAGKVTRTIINSPVQAQFHCVSDDHYMGRKQDEGVDYD
jgi:hypothetical protein